MNEINHNNENNEKTIQIDKQCNVEIQPVCKEIMIHPGLICLDCFYGR